MKSRQCLIVTGIVVLAVLLGSLAGPLPHKAAATTLNNRLERDRHLPNAADFDKDNTANLAVGVEWEDVGSVTILYGTPDGISATDNRFWHQDSTNLEGVAETSDHFGCALVRQLSVAEITKRSSVERPVGE